MSWPPSSDVVLFDELSLMSFPILKPLKMILERNGRALPEPRAPHTFTDSGLTRRYTSATVRTDPDPFAS